MRDSLVHFLNANGGTPSTFLELLDGMTEGEVWRKLRDRRGRPFDRFTDFVTADQPEGLGCHDADDLRKRLELEHKEEREPYRRQVTVDRMAAMRQRVKSQLHEDTLEAPDRPRGGMPAELRGTNYRKQPTTDTVEYVMGRLKRDDPELALQVINGTKSPDAAAREKGWRKPRIVLSTPDRVARRLRDHFKDPEQRALLAELLTKED